MPKAAGGGTGYSWRAPALGTLRLALVTLIGVFLLGLCGLCAFDLPLPWIALWAAGTAAALASAAGLALVAAQPVTARKLTPVLQLRPGDA